jgi:hypothetical protein
MPQMSTLGALSQAWVSAEAALPLGWRLIGVWRNAESPDTWTATASGAVPAVDLEVGRGQDPVQALHRLADSLQVRRGSLSGGA